MNNEQNQQLDELKSALERHEEGMMEIFIKEGPDALRSRLNVRNDHDWKLIFDYLVVRKNVLERCTIDYMPFFRDLVANHGPQVLKSVFKIDGLEYSQPYERLLDMVAVSHGAIYQYVLNSKEELAQKVMQGDSKNLRHDLGIQKRKYDGLWAEILDLLMDAVCQKSYGRREIEEGLRAFILLMTGLREQRSLRSFRKMWAFETNAT